MSAMTLQELRTSFREWVDDPRAMEWTEARADHFLNFAYRELVRVVMSSAAEWNVHDSPFLIAADPQHQEYELKPLGPDGEPWAAGAHWNIRKIIDIVRTNARWKYSLARVPFTERNRYGRLALLPYVGVADSGVGTTYVYRRGDGLWMLGFSDQTPSAQNLEIWYVPQIKPLTDAAEYPVQVPQQWHHLISMYGGVLAREAVNRDVRQLRAEFETLKRSMAGDMETIVSRMKSRRWP